MKTTSSLPRTALLALVLGTAGVTAALAQTSTTPSTPPASGHQSALTADEKAQYQKAHDQALADNADLKTEEDNLTKQRETMKGSGANASASDKQAFHTAMQEHRDK